MDGFSRLSLAVARLYKLMQQLKFNGMKEFDLKGEQTFLLYQMYRHPDGITFSQLLDATQLDRAMVSRNLKKCREAGLVFKKDEEKKYKSCFILTDEGNRIMSRVDTIISQVEVQAREGICEEDMNIFYAVLGKLTENLQDIKKEWKEE